MHTARERLGEEELVAVNGDIGDKQKPWLIRSNHEEGVPGFTSVGVLPSYRLIRGEGEDGLSESRRRSGSYYHGGHSVRAPARLAESSELSYKEAPLFYFCCFT